MLQVIYQPFHGPDAVVEVVLLHLNSMAIDRLLTGKTGHDFAGFEHRK